MSRIAVVDNDRSLLALLEELFTDEGWEVVAHAEGRGAFDLLKREQPDIVLLDLWLETPVSGWKVLQELRIDPATRAIPVVLLSGAPEDLKGKQPWLNDHGIPIVAKPFDIDDLYRTVSHALGEDTAREPASPSRSRRPIVEQ